MSATAVPITIRDAHDGDIAAITAIYNHLVRHSTAVWDEVEVDQANRASWLSARRNGGFPVILAIDAGATPD
jgi:phosphinothricin acetyltransferase